MGYLFSFLFLICFNLFFRMIFLKDNVLYDIFVLYFLFVSI